MSKRVYKFTRARFGIASLQRGRLKVSTIDDLNDPFDLCPINTSNPDLDRIADSLVTRFRARFGLLCFSRNWDNILLWSHYGDSHQGVCLGFDIPEGNPGENYDTDVLYQANLLQLRNRDDINIDLASRLHRTKHESWSYEQEVRMFIELKDPPDQEGRHWIDFGPNLVLKEVIIGAQCSPETSKEIEVTVRPLGSSVVCSWAGMRRDAFLLVRQEQPPWWHVRHDRPGRVDP